MSKNMYEKILFILLLTVLSIFSGFINLYSVNFTNYLSIIPGIYSLENGITLGDFDNDGDIDIIICGDDNEGNYILAVYTNNGKGYFSSKSKISNFISWGSIASADIDNDNDLDIVITGYDNVGSYFAVIYTNDGSASFGFNNSLLHKPGSGSVALQDIDNDGDVDILITGETNGTGFISEIYTNNKGFFSLKTNLTPVANSSVTFADINSDGYWDIILTGSSFGNFYNKVFKNQAGSFTNLTEVNPGINYSSIASGDIDADSDYDIVVTGADSSGGLHTKVYKNDGTGNFTLFQDILPAVKNGSIALGDLDNDGDLDLVLTGEDSGSQKYFLIFTNNSFGYFVTNISINPSVNYSSIALADFDNDGDLDLVMVGLDSSNITHLEFYKNNAFVLNNPPTTPSGVTAFTNGGYWKFKWEPSIDDHTPQNLLRYQIAIGFHSGNYEYISSAINYPRGQATIGNIPSSVKLEYQSKIASTKKVYYKIAAIDSAFKINWSPEYVAELSHLPGKELPKDFSNIIIYPNPCYENDTIYFKNLPDKSKIKIYNLLGELIEEIESKNGEAIWNTSKFNLASSVYIVYIYTSDGKYTKKKILYGVK